MSKTIKAAVVQTGPVLFDTPKTMSKLAERAREATGLGANLVVFPEAFVGGYPKGIDFGARLGMRSPEGREDFRRYHESAIDLRGPEMTRLGEIARDNAIHLVVGVIERDGGTLYCTALTFSPLGRLIAKHRKLMPTALERLVWGFGDGSTIGVAETPIGRIGSVICWENYMPLLRTAMYAQGIELYCAPTVRQALEEGRIRRRVGRTQNQRRVHRLRIGERLTDMQRGAGRIHPGEHTAVALRVPGGDG